MQIQLNTDKNIEGNERLEAYVNEKIGSSLNRFSDKITRVEVHLSDQNGEKGGKDDQQCRMEVRLKGLQPITITAREAQMEQAISAAIDKMKSSLETTLGKLASR
jgi:ribosomal subunit interface protein